MTDTPRFKPKAEKISKTGKPKAPRRGMSAKTKARQEAERAVYERARAKGIFV